MLLKNLWIDHLNREYLDNLFKIFDSINHEDIKEIKRFLNHSRIMKLSILKPHPDSLEI